VGHLAIAQELDQADRGDEALAWAQRGLHEAKRRTDGWSSTWRTGTRRPAAGTRCWRCGRDRFAADATLAGYLRLRQAATAAGRWARPSASRRSPLLDGEGARAAPGAGRGLDWTGPVLVDALLDDGRRRRGLERGRGAPRRYLARAVAAARRPGRRGPAGGRAGGLYRQLIEPLRPQTGDKIYEQAARLLRSAGPAIRRWARPPSSSGTSRCSAPTRNASPT